MRAILAVTVDMSCFSAETDYMAEALALAHGHLGLTGMNPSVGCVIVKDGEIVGCGVTAASGRPHAETEALKEAGDAARGATAYVTLEPCSHHGKTPPCADALVEAGVAKVFVAMEDPDPRVAGRGINRLREAGIDVEVGLLQDVARRELAAYLTRQTKGRAFVTLKMAVSQDGMIGRRGSEQVLITGAEVRKLVHLLRAENDAILVGIGTVLGDDPELTCRLPGMFDRSPVRIIFDRDLRLPLDSLLVKSAGQVPVMVVTDKSNEALGERVSALEAHGVEILRAEDLHGLLVALVTREVSSVLVEGGAEVATSFLNAGLVDRIVLFKGQVTVGEGGIASPISFGQVPDGFVLAEEGEIDGDLMAIYEREG